ncbi:hypothetical protein T08_743 [Trichinella sp. T8]|nr:hypothetical protein T08_743 [Trichinella sp. T8]
MAAKLTIYFGWREWQAGEIGVPVNNSVYVEGIWDG